MSTTTIIIAAFAFATSMTVVVVYFLTRMVDDRAARLVFFIVGALSPAMLIVAGIRTLLYGRSELSPCPEALAQVESEIERERVELFGGKPLDPPFAVRWQTAYLESLRRTASRVDWLFTVVVPSRERALPLYCPR